MEIDSEPSFIISNLHNKDNKEVDNLNIWPLYKYCSACTSNEIQKLRELGISTVETILSLDNVEFIKYTAMDSNKLQQIQMSILSDLDINRVEMNSLYDLYYSPSAMIHIQYSSGTDSIDNLLHGGISSGEITEIVGSSASGKTQFLLQVTSVNSLLDNTNIIYIDTAQSCSIDRIKQLLKVQQIKYSLSKDLMTKAVNRIRIYSCFHIVKLLQILQDIEARMKDCLTVENHYYQHVSMIVIDSLGSIMNTAMGSYATRLGKSLIQQVTRLLKHMKLKYNIAILTSNYTVSNIHTENKPQTDTINYNSNSTSLKPALGLSWTNFADTRLTILDYNFPPDYNNNMDQDDNKNIIDWNKGVLNKKQCIELPYKPITIELSKSPNNFTSNFSQVVHCQITKNGFEPFQL